MKKRNQKSRKKPEIKQKNININANILLNKWIWISLALTFITSITMFTFFFIFKKDNQIHLPYLILTIIALIPFPFSLLIQDLKISVKSYIAKGNLKKIKGYKSQTVKLLTYTVIIVILFIIFDFIFVGLTQLKVIAISTSWLYLFGLLSNIVSLILSAVFGFTVSNIINAPLKFKEKYRLIKTKLYQLKVFLNVNNLKKIDYQELKYLKIDFLPFYFYQSLLISNIKKEHFFEELENWKYYLTLSSYLNQFSWLVFLHHAINKEEQLKLIKKSKYITKLASQIKKIHTILFHTNNDFIYFNNDYDAKKLEKEYNQLMNILFRYKNRFTLKMIIASLEKKRS